MTNLFSKIRSKELVLYMVCLTLYFLQGTLYATGSIISRTLLIIVFIISFHCLVKVLFSKYRLDIIGRIIFVFISIVTLYCIFGPQYSGVNNVNQLKGVYLSMLSFFVAYRFVISGKLNINAIVWILLLFMIISVCSYYSYIDRQNELLGKSLLSGELTNNSGYLFVFLFPLICLLPKLKLFQLCSMVIAFMFSLLSAKRGAIITSSCCLFILLYVIYRTFKMQKRLFLGVLILIIIIGIGMYYISSTFASNIYLQHRLEATLEGNSSNRDVIYSSIFRYLQSSENSFFNVIFGAGYAATTQIEGTSHHFAHSDWLELLVDFGLLGTVIYFSLYYNIIKCYLKNRKRISLNMSSSFLCIIIILVLTSLTSMSFMDEGHVIVFFTLGFIVAYIKRDYAKR